MARDRWTPVPHPEREGGRERAVQGGFPAGTSSQVPQSRRGSEEQGAGDGIGGHSQENAAGRQRAPAAGLSGLSPEGEVIRPSAALVIVPRQATEVALRRGLTNTACGWGAAARREVCSQSKA